MSAISYPDKHPPLLASSKSRPRSKTAAPSKSRQSLGAPRPKKGSAENIANIRQSSIETAERQIEAGTHSLTATHLAQQQLIGGHRPSKLRRLAMDGQEAEFLSTLGDANAPNGCSEKVRIFDSQDFAERHCNFEDEQRINKEKGKEPRLATLTARAKMITSFKKQGCKVEPGYTNLGRNSYGGSNGITHVDVYHICLHSRPSGLEDVKKITSKGCTKKDSGRSCGCANHHHGCWGDTVKNRVSRQEPRRPIPKINCLGCYWQKQFKDWRESLNFYLYLNVPTAFFSKISLYLSYAVHLCSPTYVCITTTLITAQTAMPNAPPSMINPVLP